MGTSEPLTRSRAARRRVLITGASGFVGRGLLQGLVADARWVIRVATRRPVEEWPGAGGGFEQVLVGDLGPDTLWGEALQGVDAIVHAAARVHVVREHEADPRLVFKRVNTDGTLQLARAAAAAGVRRFVFLSSIKVNGESTPPGRPFREEDAPAPADQYGASKYDAEVGLLSLARATGMEVVVVRSPLVYGPGVKANFESLMRYLRRGIPLPFGAIGNRRTLVALDNLVDLLITCIDHPAAANEVFLAGDAEDLSTPDLLRRLAAAMGRPARLIPVRQAWIEAAARLLGQGATAQRLCRSLQVDIGKARRLLGWTPPLDVDAALHRTASHFLAAHR